MRLLRVFLLILAGVGCFSYGLAAGVYRLFPYQQARALVRELRLILQESPSTSAPVQLDAGDRQRLETLGYLPSYEEASDDAGLVQFDVDRAFLGFNFYVSAHAPEAHLIAMDGAPLHRWRFDYARACPQRSVAVESQEHPTEEYDPEAPEAWRGWRQGYWRRAKLLPGGDVIAVFDYEALIRVDADSNLVWARCDAYHHDLSVDGEGRIYTLRRVRRWASEIDATHALLDDLIEVLTPQGQVLRQVSVLEALQSSDYASHLKHIEPSLLAEGGDVFHTNTVKILEGLDSPANPAFRNGNVLISIKHLDLVAAVDMELERVTWALSGMWRYQHEPILLATGNILVFDNAGRGGRSRVLEVEPDTQRIAWSFPQPGDHDLASGCCGSVRRLPNGNTLITETSRGRALEVAPDHEVVWEWVNPHRVGRNEMPLLLEVVRIDPGATESWLGAPNPRAVGGAQNAVADYRSGSR